MTAHSQERASDVSDTDQRGRIASTAVGGALLLYGLRRRSFVGTVMAIVGGLLFYRGISGNGTLETSTTGATERHGTETDAEPMEVERSITVGKSADELYELWRDPQQLSRIVGSVAEVSSEGDGRHRWSVDGPLGREMAWETRIVEERPGEFLRWKAIEGSALSIEGSLRFRQASGDRGTEVTLHVRVDPPGGALGGSVMERFGVVPDTLVGKALRRFKSLAETGEIPTLEHNPSARGSSDLV